MLVLKHFYLYTSLGLKTIPLRPQTKIPMLKQWNEIWNKIEIERLFRKNPNANIGLILGDIVDVECDDMKSNELLQKLIGNYSCPRYISKRSIHNLFINPDPNLSWVKYNGIEFRGYNHQSVLPPSKGIDTKYLWRNKNILSPIPEMPKALLDFYKSNKKGQELIVKPGHIKVWCSKCKRKKPINEKRYYLEKEAFKSIGIYWECRKCRTTDIRPLCRKIKKLHKDHSL